MMPQFKRINLSALYPIPASMKFQHLFSISVVAGILQHHDGDYSYLTLNLYIIFEAHWRLLLGISRSKCLDRLLIFFRSRPCNPPPLPPGVSTQHQRPACWVVVFQVTSLIGIDFLMPRLHLAELRSIFLSENVMNAQMPTATTV